MLRFRIGRGGGQVMSIAIWFWLLFVLSLLFGGSTFGWPEAKWPRLWPFAVIVLIGLLGWRVFGGPVQ